MAFSPFFSFISLLLSTEFCSNPLQVLDSPQIGCELGLFCFFYPMLFHQEPQSWNPSQQPCHPHLEHGQKSWISINLDLTSPLTAPGTLLLCLTSCRLCCLSSSQPFTFAFFTQSSGSSYFLLSLWFVFHATTLLKQPHTLLQTFCSEVFTSFLTFP